jgi:hypothetical protein
VDADSVPQLVRLARRLSEHAVACKRRAATSDYAAAAYPRYRDEARAVLSHAREVRLGNALDVEL